MLVFHGGTPTWLLHSGQCKFVQIAPQIFEVSENVETSNLEKCLIYLYAITLQYTSAYEMKFLPTFLF